MPDLQVDIKISASPQLQRALDPARAQRAIQDALVKAGSTINRSAVANVNNKTLRVQSGNLKGSIRTDISRISRGEVRVGVLKNASYGAAHEFGAVTKPHVIVPRFAKALRWATAFGMISRKATRFAFAKKVNHPGSVIPKRPWLMPAYTENKERILGFFRDALQRSLKS